MTRQAQTPPPAPAAAQPKRPRLPAGGKSRRRLNALVPLPPTLTGATVLRIPRHLHDDAVQEAWAAHLAGQDPNLAVWSFLDRFRRAERRCVCFSQLEPDELERIYSELPE
jgi:hypothetical protein